MLGDDDSQHEEQRAPLVIEAPGVDEVGVVPWALLLRQRMRRKMAESDRYRWIVLGVALLGFLTVTFTITILAVSIPTISEDLGTSQNALTWLITGPTLAFAVIGPLVGKLGDLRGHRPVYLIGLTGAGVFAALSALAWSGPSLIAFRVLGATIGAATGPSSMAIINRAFRPEERAQAMGYWTMVMAGGPVLGVVVGGPVVEAFTWRWIFIAQVPLTILAVVVAYAVLPATDKVPGVRFDLSGAIALTAAVTLALLGLNQGPTSGWDSPLVVGAFALAPLALLLFVRIERRVPDPLIPLEYFRRRNFAFPIGVDFFLNFAYMGGFILTPLLLQEVLGYGETRAGLLSIARPLTFAVAGPIAGYLVLRVGERLSASFGAATIVASMIGLSTVGPGTSDAVVVAALALSGVGLGASVPSMSSLIANAVDIRDLGVVGASQQMLAQLGAATGIQIMQTVQAAREHAVGLAESYSQAYLVGGAVAAAGLACAVYVRSTPREPAIR